MIPATFPSTISATKRRDFLLCPHFFFRRHCQRIEHGLPSLHLHFGKCIASGLEATRRAYAAGAPQIDALPRGAAAIVREWGEFPLSDRPTRTEAVKTLANCLLAHDEYFKQWPLHADPIQIARYNGEPCIEFKFRKPIPDCYHPVTGKQLEYSGKFDLVGTFGGSHWGLDDKTTGSIGSSWVDEWRLRGQLIGYTWGVLDEMPLTGFLVRGVQPLTSAPTRLVETPPLPIPPWKIDRWLRQLQVDVQRMIDYWQAWVVCRHLPDEADPTGVWPRIMDDGCYSYNRACEYMPLCDTPHPERWVSEYIQKPASSEAEAVEELE